MQSEQHIQTHAEHPVFVPKEKRRNSISSDDDVKEMNLCLLPDYPRIPPRNGCLHTSLASLQRMKNLVCVKYQTFITFHLRFFGFRYCVRSSGTDSGDARMVSRPGASSRMSLKNRGTAASQTLNGQGLAHRQLCPDSERKEATGSHGRCSGHHRECLPADSNKQRHSEGRKARSRVRTGTFLSVSRFSDFPDSPEWEIDRVALNPIPLLASGHIYQMPESNPFFSPRPRFRLLAGAATRNSCHRSFAEFACLGRFAPRPEELGCSPFLDIRCIP